MRHRTWAIALAVVVVVALGAQVSAERADVAKARALYETAGASNRPLEARIDDARAAVALQPQVIAYRQRAASLEAERAVQVGALDDAREILIAAWTLDRSAMYLREQLREVNGLIFARDSRKAHVLHGREGPGGVLDPEDLMP